MKARWDIASNWVADRSLRERVILFATLLVFILFVWVQFVFTPLDLRVKADRKSVNETNSQIAALATEMNILEQRLKVDPNQALRQEQTRLKSELNSRRAEMRLRLKEMVAPDEMAEVLRRVMGKVGGLTLLEVRNLPTEPFIVSSPAAEGVSAPKGDQAVPVYKHALELRLNGGFFEMLKYLRALETQEHRFQWRVLDVSVGTFPQMKIRLVVQTLSLEKEWIGV